VTEQTPFPPGARILVRGETEWMVRSCAPAGLDGFKIRAIGVSELVRETEAVFFTELEDPKPILLRPEDTVLIPDDTPAFAKSRLFLEATLRRTPLPQSERGLATRNDSFLLDPLTYQQRPAELALKNLWPRILIADVVGLGKTLEIGLILAELIKRGRGDRILVVTPQQVLEQFQHELWTRFAIPLIRLDSLGIERIQREIPAGRNPFTYYKRIIISVDTLKNQGKYGHHLDVMNWDAVVIDESHNLIGESTLRNELARKLAKHADALILASATPHNGDAESFAELIRMLDPAAIADPRHYEPKDIEHLYIRRTKISPAVTNEIGDNWKPRGPSVPLRCAATPAEERVFAELTQTWLAPQAHGGARPKSGRDRLFAYTLLKAFLSSHKALAQTARKRQQNSTDEAEKAALQTLIALSSEITSPDSAKLTRLVAHLKSLGVGPGSRTRAVVFSESVPTLKWLHQVLPGLLGTTRYEKDSPGHVDIMHGGIADTEQQKIVERFSLADSEVRVLLTGDVASEGVNMHRQCHHLIHYDLPWSLIRIEQRNGRIDRYGQEHKPEFAALILASQVDGAKDDTTVAEKLLNREAEAHRALGTAEGVTREFTARREEDRLVKDLLNGLTVEESIRAQEEQGGFEGDFLAGLLAGVGDQPDASEIERAAAPTLFTSTEAFAREALHSAVPGLHVDDDGEMLAFTPPDDLIQRLDVLPASYLREHKVAERMKVSFNRGLAQRKLDEARQSKKTLWPEIAYLSDLHPMIEWLTDKVLIRVVRQQAPVIIAKVAEPVFLVQGVYSNALGQPTVVQWMAIGGLPGDARIEDMTTVLSSAGVGPRMVNTGKFGDIDALAGLIPAAVVAARTHLKQHRETYEAQVDGPINAYRDRLVTWEQLSLIDATSRKREQISVTARERSRETELFRTTGEPLLRILGVLVPEATGVQGEAK
jgi:ERCC4-related helicase